MAKVIMYTTTTWPHCVPAKEFLKQNNIDFVEKNVSVDKVARKEMMGHRLMGVPSFVVNGEPFVGLDKAKILATLD